MGLGISDDAKLAHVPGTATLSDLVAGSKPTTSAQNAHLKHSTGSNPVILVPQPSDSPNDPLNWPLWRRDLMLAILCLLSVLASTSSPSLAANTLTLVIYFQRPFTEMALSTGYHLLGVGLAGFSFVPSARVYGKRHAYIIGTVVIIVASAWGGASGHNYASSLWARVFQGVGLAPFEASVNASVGDLYFVHERGKRMAASNLALFGGAFFTPVIVGKITSAMGWQWTFYFIAIFTGLMSPSSVLFVPETTFERAGYSNTDTQMTGDAPQANSNEVPYGQDGSGTSSLEKPAGHVDASPSSATQPEQKTSFAQSSLPFNGRHTSESFWKLALRPFPLFLQPSILWACSIQGLSIGWTVLIGIVLAAIMSLPPLVFNEVETGYMYTGAFIGALLGFAIAGSISDSSVKSLTKWNGGIYEPEFRLVSVIPQLVFGCAGLYGFGITSSNTYKYGWFWPDFFFALEVSGMVSGAVASALYIVDAHRDIAVEAFTCLLVFKNIFSFGLTWSGFNWINDIGVKRSFVIVGSVQVAVCCTTILMYIFGKWNRSFWARHDMLKMLKLR